LVGDSYVGKERKKRQDGRGGKKGKEMDDNGD